MNDTIPTRKRTGIIFRAGNYGAKGEYTDADLDAMCGDVNVPIKMSHGRTLLDNKLGSCERAFVGFDEAGGKVLMGEWSEPEPLSLLLGDTPRTLSVEIGLEDKKLKAVALEVNPHIKDAAFFSDQVEQAFAQFSKGEPVAQFRYESEAERDAIPAEDFGDPANKLFPVRTQQELRQAYEELAHAEDPTAVKARILEIAARKGLKVEPSPWYSTEGVSKPISADAGMAFYSQENNGMKVFIPTSNGSRSGTAEEVVAFTGGTIGADTRGLQIQDESGHMSKATPEAIVAFTDGKVKFETPAAQIDAETQAKLDRLAKFEADEREGRMSGIQTDAEAAFNVLLTDKRVLPADKEKFVAAFSAAAVADANADTRKGVACFAEGAPTADFSMTAFLTETFKRLPQHSNGKEQVGGLDKEQIAAFEQENTTVTDPETGAVEKMNQAAADKIIARRKAEAEGKK